MLALLSCGVAPDASILRASFQVQLSLAFLLSERARQAGLCQLNQLIHIQQETPHQSIPRSAVDDPAIRADLYSNQTSTGW